MTTVYVNHSLGVVMTDTRTTTTYDDYLFGFIPCGSHDEYNDNGLKAIHVHDRIFVESGSCAESTKILQYLTHGTPIVPAPKKYKLSSSCFFVDKNWLLHFRIDNGEVIKRFYPVSPSAWYCTGSGSEFLAKELEKYNFKPTMQEAISAFKTVHLSDRFTNNQVKIYHM